LKKKNQRRAISFEGPEQRDIRRLEEEEERGERTKEMRKGPVPNDLEGGTLFGRHTSLGGRGYRESNWKMS